MPLQLRRELKDFGSFAAYLRTAGLHQDWTAAGIKAFVSEVVVRGRKDLYALLPVHAANLPNKLALVCGSRQYTYAQLNERVLRFAAGLEALGASPKEKVVIALGNCAEAVISLAGATQVGCVVVPVSTHFKAHEFQNVVENAAAKVVCLTSEQWLALGGTSAHTPEFLAGRTLVFIGKREGWPDQALAWEDVTARPVAEHRARDHDPHLMLYTSGTTGHAKGALLDLHRISVMRAMEVLGVLGFSKSDRFYTACPIYHAAPVAMIGFTFIVGGTVFVGDHFDAAATWRDLSRLGITSGFFVPTQLVRFMRLEPESLAERPLALRRMLSGGAPLALPVKQQALAVFGPVVYDFYGATELGLVSLATPEDLRRKPGTIGRPFPGVCVRFFDPAGGSKEVAEGEIGELSVTSDQLNFAYHGNEAATQSTLRGAYRTVGDLGYRDADGYLFLTDRKSDVIISGGVNIYPAEIENELLVHPCIGDACVIGLPDPEWGESVCAVVVRKAGAALSADDVIAYCQSRLASLKKPKRVEFVAELPRSPQGKVLKQKLRADLRKA